jgi:hypothetical protein
MTALYVSLKAHKPDTTNQPMYRFEGVNIVAVTVKTIVAFKATSSESTEGLSGTAVLIILV